MARFVKARTRAFREGTNQGFDESARWAWNTKARPNGPINLIDGCSLLSLLFSLTRKTRNARKEYNKRKTMESLAAM